MSSIEWLLSELEKVNYHPTEAMIMYAKKLHKKEMKESWQDGFRFDSKYINFEEYYQSKFKKENT